jgi:hypothetical protein
MKCFICFDEIETSDRFFIGLDIPYVNILVHKVCWRGIRDEMLEYFTVNYTRLEEHVSQIKNRKPIKMRNLTHKTG